MKIRHFLLCLCSLYFIKNTQAQTLSWSFETLGSIHSTPVIDDNILYIGSGDNHFYALDHATGEKIWDFTSDAAIHSTACIWENLVIFGNENGSWYALNKETGELEWKFQSEAKIPLDLWDYYLSSPVVKNDRVYFGSQDGHLYALHVDTGELQWKFQTGGAIHATPTLYDNKVFVGNFKGGFFALNAEKGNPIWKFQVVGSKYFPDGEIHQAALVYGDLIYFGSRDLNLYALDIHTGEKKWNMLEKGGSWIIATPFVHQENIYFGSSDTYKFYSLNKKDGRENWGISVNTRVYGAAQHYGDLIVFGGFDGRIQGIAPQTGEVKWVYQTATSKENFSKLYDENGDFRKDLNLKSAEESEVLIESLGSIINTPLIHNGVIYFGSVDGRMYAVKMP